MLYYLVSCPQFLQILQDQKGEMGVLLFKTNHLHLYQKVTFGKHLTDGDWLPGGPTRKRGLKLFVPPSYFWKWEKG